MCSSLHSRGYWLFCLVLTANQSRGHSPGCVWQARKERQQCEGGALLPPTIQLGQLLVFVIVRPAVLVVQLLLLRLIFPCSKIKRFASPFYFPLRLFGGKRCIPIGRENMKTTDPRWGVFRETLHQRCLLRSRSSPSSGLFP
jgi:hypothetical protein